MPNPKLAKEIILQIIAEAGGRLQNTTSLYKAFYFAHLYFAEENSGFLSDWPIVRMPHGPGIDAAHSLISELVAEGRVELRHTQIGPYVGIEYRLAKPTSAEGNLPVAAKVAIEKAVSFVRGKTATELSEVTHEFSRSWNETKNGDEQNIYIDLIPEDEYNLLLERGELNRQALVLAWGA